MSKGANTRQMIIEKSAELFNQKGYSGCSLSDIMNYTGLKKGGIYNHFENKDEIALEAFDWAYAQVIAKFRSKLDLDKTPVDKLYSIISVFETFVHDPVIKGGCPIMNSAMDASDTHPELLAKARAGVEMLHKYVSIKVEEGKQAGTIRNVVDSDMFATLLVSSLEGAVVLSRATGDDYHITKASEFMKYYIKANLVIG